MPKTSEKTMKTGPPPTSGYVDLIRGNSNYRAVWLGEIVSLFGDWFNLIASAALVSSLTRSGIAVSGLFVVRMLAPFLVSPLAGVIADRYNRKSVLIFADLTRFIVVLGFLLVRSPQHTWLLYALTAIQLGISGFFFPARNAILPDIVSARELGAANALSSATWSTMLAFGAAIGGLVAGEFGIYPAFIVDAVSFLVSALFIARIRYHPPKSEVHRYQPASIAAEAALADCPPEIASATGLTAPGGTLAGSSSGEPAQDRPPARPAPARSVFSARVVLGQYLEGLKYLRRHLDILAIALHKGAISLAVNGAFQVVQVALAERLFVIGERGSTSLGLLFAAAGVGTGIGPLIARRFTGDRNRPMRIAIALTYPVMAIGVAITAGLSSFRLVLLGSFVRAFAGGVIWVFSTQLLLHNVPGEVRGRVFSTEFAIFTLASATGTALGGWALDAPAFGLARTLWTMAVLALVPGVLWVWWLRRAG